MVEISASVSGRNTGHLEWCSELVSILSRALQAAHAYETLRTASGRQLAKQGLTHSDLPRAAYTILIGESDANLQKQVLQSFATEKPHTPV
jgi:hypothetical protein